VDPPAELGQPGQIALNTTDVPGLSILRYQTFFPYRLKFHARPLFDLLMRLQAKRLVNAAGRPDLVWDFDNAYQFRDLMPFGAGTTLFHLVDDVGEAGLGTKGADHVFYLHRSFCMRAGGLPLADHEIGHGLGRAHARAAAQAGDPTRRAGPPHLGFVGNLAAPWIDWAAVAEMLHRHPQARFTFWGPLPSAALDPLLQGIVEHPATRFPGLTAPERILDEAADVDLWLIPLRANRLPGGALNSHKVLEYLATGKAVAMTRLEAYTDSPLVYMPDAAANEALPDLVYRLLTDLEGINAPALVAGRRAFALERSYDRQLERVLNIAGLTEPSKRNYAA
jgi:hypothetical protein